MGEQVKVFTKTVLHSCQGHQVQQLLAQIEEQIEANETVVVN